MITAGTALSSPPEFIKLIAHDIRWAILRVLTIGDYRVHELVELVQQPMNLVSYHLKKMRDEAIVTTRRSEADGRDIYYSLDLSQLRRMYFEAGMALHPTISTDRQTPDVSRLPHKRVLFVCTHNSARSQMAEGLLRHLSDGHFDVYSAGSHPTSVHPDAVRTMNALGVDISHQRSHVLDEYARMSFDTVITVCDRAREACPTFPGAGEQIHWGLTDPIAVQDVNERRELFERTARQLKARIEYFISTIPLDTDT